MSDIFERVTSQQDIFKQILAKVPGFNGYVERENRRSSDKLLRETIANRFEALWGRISALQRDLISHGGIAYINDLESAAIQLRQFIDRVRTGAYGYAGLFDAAKINEKELALIYQYDYAMLVLADTTSHAIDNVEASMGTDGLPAAIRNLVAVSRQCVEAYDKRLEILQGRTAEGPEATPAE